MNTQNKRKNILVVTSTFPRWERDKEPPFVFELCRRLKEHYDIYVLAPHAPGSATEEQLAGLNVTRFRYFFSPWENLAYQGGILERLKQNSWRYGLAPFFVLAELFALIRLQNRLQVDLIHAHWLFPQGLVAVLARMFVKSPSPLLCTSHGGDLYGLKGILFNRVKRFVLTRSNAVSVVSRAMRKEVILLINGYAKVRVIPMGVDLQNQFVPPPERPEKGSLLFVGRLVEKKGVRYLIEAIPHILKKHPHIKLRIVGDGPEKPALRRQVSELRADDRVQFLGAVENNFLPALYQSSDVVIFPSMIADDGDQEGFGLVLVEALGCECAVVVTDLPAMKDIITDGKTGLVVPSKNVQVIAEKVVYLLDNPEFAKSIGKKGRRYVLKRYDWPSITNQYEVLIELLINHHSIIFSNNS